MSPCAGVSSTLKQACKKFCLCYVLVRRVKGLQDRKGTEANASRDCSGTKDHSWLDQVVEILDRAILLTSIPNRQDVFDFIFAELASFVPSSPDDLPLEYDIQSPTRTIRQHQIEHSSEALDFIAFDSWMNYERKPLIISDALEHWPARQKWKSPCYLMQQSLGGRRIVPVELGESYTSEHWTQRTMTIKEFMTEYLLPAQPQQVGYLAQYDLFKHIPSLRDDIMVPDYCYVDPPCTTGDELDTSGLGTVDKIDEPLMNAWLGPEGTKTPLHTDPYHNIFCQVIGYKYVRLYPPSESSKLYPRGRDDSGINMDNTSQIDVSHFCNRDGSFEPSKLVEMEERFPNFEGAQYVDGMLEPGDLLYVPLGWWHYVESLTTSFSVSFWWN